MPDTEGLLPVFIHFCAQLFYEKGIIEFFLLQTKKLSPGELKELSQQQMVKPILYLGTLTWDPACHLPQKTKSEALEEWN